MSAPESLCLLIGMNRDNFSREENGFVEAELFFRLCTEFKQFFYDQLIQFIKDIKTDIDKEDTMDESKIVNLMITDILSTKSYTLEGLAYYTHTHEDIIHEVMTDKNVSPSMRLFKKVIELHRSLRPEIYENVRQKIRSLQLVN